MPPSENGNAELVRKILSRKEKNKEVKERENSPLHLPSHGIITLDETPEEIAIAAPPSKVSRFNQVPMETEERVDDVADLGNLTAADLRKSSMGEF